jgi:hypothetical protein
VSTRARDLLARQLEAAYEMIRRRPRRGDAVTALEEGHTLLTDDLEGLANADLDGPRMTNWGEEKPTWWIFWTMIEHDVHHGAEIGVLRDLYRVRSSS